MTSLAAALRAFDARGQLRVDDPESAAEHFAFLAIGASLDRALFDAETDAAGAAAAVERAERGVAVFLRAYAA